MPTTSRWSVHGVQGRIDCINYIKDSKKTKDGTLITGINCSSQFAAYEMKVNNDKFHIIEDNDSRTCYHGYQSFDPKEKGLTPEKVHEMGVELMKRLYPDFQVLVTTHIDRSHLHNHYVINAVNLKGRKLEDRLANPIEGLYGLRDMSDKIALEYGLKIIEDAPKIGRFGKSKYLYSEAIKTWRQQIIEKIEYLKSICFSFDELLERLAFDGYQIKAGKNIRIRPYGKERFVSIKTLGEGYSEAELKEFFKQKRKNQTVIDFEKYKLLDEDSEILSLYNELAIRSKQSILYSMKDLDANNDYFKYYNSRYMEIRRYHQLVDTINFLNDNKIFGYETLEEQIEKLKQDIISKETEYQELASENETLQLRVPLCNLYLEYLDIYESYKEQQELSSSYLEPSKEVKTFLDVKEQLGVQSLDEVQDILAETNRLKVKTNKSYAYLTYLKTKASELEKIKGISLESEKGYIKSVSVSKSMIDESRSTKENYCLRIPYSENYIYVPKGNIAWISFDKRGILYLVDDKEYILYDKYNEEKRRATGEEIEKISQEEKQKINDYYKNK